MQASNSNNNNYYKGQEAQVNRNVQASMTDAHTIVTFTKDLLLNIFRNFREYEDFARISLVCKKWHLIIKDPSIDLVSMKMDYLAWKAFKLSKPKNKLVSKLDRLLELMHKDFKTCHFSIQIFNEVFAISPDRKQLATLDNEIAKNIQLYTSDRGVTKIQIPQSDKGKTYDCLYLTIHDVFLTAVYSEGEYRDRIFCTYSLANGTRIFHHKSFLYPSSDHYGKQANQFYSAENKYLAFTCDYNVNTCILDLTTGESQRLESPQMYVRPLNRDMSRMRAVINCIGLKNEQLIVAFNNGYILIWNINPSSLKYAINTGIDQKDIPDAVACMSLALHNTSNKFVFRDNNGIKIFDLNTGTEIYKSMLTIDRILFQEISSSRYMLSGREIHPSKKSGQNNRFQETIVQWQSNDKQPPLKKLVHEKLKKSLKTFVS